MPHFKSQTSRFKSLALCAAALSFAGQLAAGDWPQWRGEKRDAHASAGSPPITSLPKELKPVWKIAAGPAFSAPVVSNGKLLYLDEQNGQEVAHLVLAGTGKEIWNVSFAKSEGDEWGTGPRSTPFIDVDRAYVQSVNGEFRCLNLADGKARWGASFPNYGVNFVGSKAGEGTAARRGNNGSGLVDGDFVYVPVGAKGASIVCFDKISGKEIWKTLDDEAAYSSFLIGTLAGVKQLVAFTADALVGVDLKSGKQLWRAPFKTQAKRHAASPVIVGPDMVTVNSFTFGIACVKITREGHDLKASELWINKQQKIHLGTPTFADGFLYSQGANQSGEFVCIDASNGQVKWSQPGYGKDQKDMTAVIANGKNLLVLTYSGQLVLVEANPEKYVELGRVQVCGNTWSFPAFADGKLYVRDNRELQCLDLTAKQVASR